MIILRDKLFFDYAKFATKYGEEAAKQHRLDRNEIAKELWKRRAVSNQNLKRELAQNVANFTPKSSDSTKERFGLGLKKAVADANAKTTRDVNHIRDLSWARGRKRHLIDNLSTLEGAKNKTNLTKAGKIVLV